MKTVIEEIATLQAHSATRSATVEGINATLNWHEARALRLTYHLKGSVSRLRIPPARAPRSSDRLWEHTCFELFVAARDSTAYYEFNFSPSGEWAVYAFRGYRDGEPFQGDGLAPGIAVRREETNLDLDAVVCLDRLPLIPPGTAIRLAVSAVIEEMDGTFSHWALKHPSERPDFHHPESFALELALTD